MESEQVNCTRQYVYGGWMEERNASIGPLAEWRWVAYDGVNRGVFPSEEKALEFIRARWEFSCK